MIESSREHLVCRVGEHWLALDSRCVQEILPRQAVVPVPLAPREVAGLMNRRGRILTIYDLQPLLGLAPATEPPQRVVVLSLSWGDHGFLVHEVDDVTVTDEASLRPPPSTLNAAQRDCLEAVSIQPQRLVQYLNLESLAQRCLPEGSDSQEP